MPPHFLMLGPKTGSVDGICQQTDSMNRFYLDVKTGPNIRIGPTDANAFRGRRLTTQKGYTYAAYKTRTIFSKKLLDRKRLFEIFRLCT